MTRYLLALALLTVAAACGDTTLNLHHPEACTDMSTPLWGREVIASLIEIQESDITPEPFLLGPTGESYDIAAEAVEEQAIVEQIHWSTSNEASPAGVLKIWATPPVGDRKLIYSVAIDAADGNKPEDGVIDLQYSLPPGWGLAANVTAGAALTVNCLAMGAILR